MLSVLCRVLSELCRCVMEAFLSYRVAMLKSFVLTFHLKYEERKVMLLLRQVLSPRWECQICSMSISIRRETCAYLASRCSSVSRFRHGFAIKGTLTQVWELG